MFNLCTAPQQYNISSLLLLRGCSIYARHHNNTTYLLYSYSVDVQSMHGITTIQHIFSTLTPWMFNLCTTPQQYNVSSLLLLCRCSIYARHHNNTTYLLYSYSVDVQSMHGTTTIQRIFSTLTPWMFNLCTASQQYNISSLLLLRGCSTYARHHNNTTYLLYSYSVDVQSMHGTITIQHIFSTLTPWMFNLCMVPQQYNISSLLLLRGCSTYAWHHNNTTYLLYCYSVDVQSMH